MAKQTNRASSKAKAKREKKFIDPVTGLEYEPENWEREGYKSKEEYERRWDKAKVLSVAPKSVTELPGYHDAKVAKGVEHCWKCQHEWTPRIPNPKKCPNCEGYDYHAPAMSGPRAEESQRIYARAHGVKVADVRRVFQGRWAQATKGAGVVKKGRKGGARKR